MRIDIKVEKDPHAVGLCTSAICCVASVVAPDSVL